MLGSEDRWLMRVCLPCGSGRHQHRTRTRGAPAIVKALDKMNRRHSQADLSEAERVEWVNGRCCRNIFVENAITMLRCPKFTR